VRSLAATISLLVALTVGASAAAASPGDFDFSYERSGGMLGDSASLVVHPGRHAVATVRRVHGAREQKVHFRIGAGRVRELEQKLREIHFFRLHDDHPGTCNDCRIFSFTYLGHRLVLAESSIAYKVGDLQSTLELVISTHVRPHHARAAA
jgi:hypothetical protein